MIIATVGLFASQPPFPRTRLYETLVARAAEIDRRNSPPGLDMPGLVPVELSQSDRIGTVRREAAMNNTVTWALVQWMVAAGCGDPTGRSASARPPASPDPGAGLGPTKTSTRPS